MNRIILAIIASFSVSFGLFAAENSEPILVRLATEVERLPLYLAPIAIEQADFDAEYAAKLKKVLEFDLDNNGMTYVVKATTEKDKVAGSSFDKNLSQDDWKGIGSFYVVKVRITGKGLAARLYAANAANAKSVDKITLTGDLSKDRQGIHQLADIIHKALFGDPGIATTKIVYTLKVKQDDKISEVWESDYDGHNRRRLTHDGYAITPLYIPPKPGFASGAILFVSYQTGQPKIYYQGLGEGGAPRRLTYLKGNQLMPAMTRQRDKLAFISDVTGNPDLFILPFSPESGITGKPYQIFATHQATQGTPTFSPDGEKIAFVSNKDGSPRIYVMDVPAAGTSLNDIRATLVTKRNKESTAPAWSPDGSKIAYCCPTNGVRQIWVYDFNTREERQVTQGPGNKENPSWAPNSLHLVFNSGDKGAAELYIINLNQTNAVKVSSGSGEKRFPCWEPR